MIDQTIILARRDQPVLTWPEIGKALGISGQAAGQHARTHDLAVDPILGEPHCARRVLDAHRTSTDVDVRERWRALCNILGADSAEQLLARLISQEHQPDDEPRTHLPRSSSVPGQAGSASPATA